MQFDNYVIAHTCSTLLIAIDNINTVCAIVFLSVVNWVCYGNKLEWHHSLMLDYGSASLVNLHLDLMAIV